MDSWLAELPMGDTGECARQIYNVLREVNSLNISHSNRLNFITGLQGPLLNIAQVLKRHYVNQNQNKYLILQYITGTFEK